MPSEKVPHSPGFHIHLEEWSHTYARLMHMDPHYKGRLMTSRGPGTGDDLSKHRIRVILPLQIVNLQYVPAKQVTKHILNQN
ncbi:hypothetical protein TNCT_348141 [Trichonephila clavata]|uniref:Uncharacterized protein n=1 Tax=Trichonephila clavata TaxID=2740835 RepID=A0A8X6KAM9_TRICU|nr:hypothetical protein TNCT_348141 [Trichonephila clavata]